MNSADGCDRRKPSSRIEAGSILKAMRHADHIAGTARQSMRAANISPTPDGASHRRGDPLFMTSLARGLRVIGAFVDAGTRLTIAELSRATGLHRAVVRRCLYTLSELGYATRDGRTYGLAPRVLGLGYAHVIGPIAVAARPVLEELSRRVGETSAVGILDEGKVVYLACAAPNNPASASAPTLGPRPPACSSAAGRVLLASLSNPQMDIELARIERVCSVRSAVLSGRALTDAVSRVRTAGYALTEEDSDLAIRLLAVPVRDASGRTLAAMEMRVPAARISREDLLANHLPVLKTAAVVLGRGLSLRAAALSAGDGQPAGVAP
jgi:IclR family transcriptional regulator, pca regulon regulatory protein